MFPHLFTLSVQNGTTPEEGLPGHQQVVALVLAGIMLIVVLELVRKRKLREEYSWLWTLTALGLIVLAVKYDLLLQFKDLISAEEPTSALFFGALVFLMLISLQFSVQLSKLTYRNKALIQRIALMEKELDDLHKEAASSGPLVEVPAPKHKSQTG